MRECVNPDASPIMQRPRRNNGLPSGAADLATYKAGLWLNGTEPGLPGYWSDNSGNGKNLTPNAPNPAQTIGGQEKWVAGAAIFAGVGYLSRAEENHFRFNTPADSWTWAAWIYPQSTGAGQALIEKVNGGTSEYRLGISNGVVTGYCADNATGQFHFLPQVVVPQNAWTLVFFGYDGSTRKMWMALNSGESVSGTKGNLLGFLPTGQLEIGKGFVGRMEGLGFWRTTLGLASRVALFGKKVADLGIPLATTNPATGIPAGSVVPAAPSGLVSATSQTPNYPPTLSWINNAPTITGFNVYQALDAGAFVRVASCNASKTSLLIADSPNHVPQLSYKVRAVNLAGESADSNVVLAAPPAPAILTFSQSGPNMIATWSGLPFATQWETQENVNGAGFVNLRTQFTSDDTWAHGKAPGTNYEIRVRILRGAVYSEWSAPSVNIEIA